MKPTYDCEAQNIPLNYPEALEELHKILERLTFVSKCLYGEDTCEIHDAKALLMTSIGKVVCSIRQFEKDGAR